MSAGFSSHLNSLLIARGEFANDDGRLVEIKFARTAMDPQSTATFLRESGHGKGNRYIIFVLHGDDLMIHDVIVASVDAAPIRTGLNRLQVRLSAVIMTTHIGRPRRSIHMNIRLNSGIGTTLFDRTAIRTTCRGSFRSILLTEVSQASKGANPKTVLTYQVS